MRKSSNSQKPKTKVSHLFITLPSSPTLSSDGTSWCVGPAGPRPGAEVRGSPAVVAVAVVGDSDCGRGAEGWAVELVTGTVWPG